MYVPDTSLLETLPSVAVTFRPVKAPIVPEVPVDVPVPLATDVSVRLPPSVVERDADIGMMFVKPVVAVFVFTRLVCEIDAVVAAWLQ